MSEVVLKVATPDALRVTVDSVVAPSLKTAVPVGVPVVADFTVAVKVTDWLNKEGLSEAVREILLESLLTMCDKAADVLALKSALPE